MLTDSLRDIATNHGWQVCDEAADEIERLERELLARSDYELGKNDGWEACETCHGIVDGVSPHRRAIESEVLQAQEPVAFPDLPAGIVLHSQLGELYDRLQVQQYALRYADASAPQPPAPCPDCEGRANGYSVLVPSAELKKLQAKVAELESFRAIAVENANVTANVTASYQKRIAEQSAEIARLKTVPMKYRRMEFNAQLQDENKQQAERIAELEETRDALWETQKALCNQINDRDKLIGQCEKAIETAWPHSESSRLGKIRVEVLAAIAEYKKGNTNDVTI